MSRGVLKKFFLNKDGTFKRGRCIENWVKEKNKNIYNLLIKETSFLSDVSDFKERLYCIANEIYEVPKCGCGKQIQFSKYLNKYKTYCSKDCQFYIKTRAKNYRKTIKDRYGVDNISQIEEVKEKKKQTCLKNYGVDNPSKKHFTNSILTLKQDSEEYKNILYKMHHLEKRSISEISKILGISDVSIGKDLKNLNIEKLKFYSCQQENEIYEFLLKLVDNKKNLIFRNKRGILKNRQELDFYIPFKKLAIEFNGLFWHSFDRPESIIEKKSHQLKSLQCRQKNIKLLTIFENEWLNATKKEIWKSIIKYHILGPEEVIYARKCSIKEISYKEFKKFCDLNHIQGSCTSSIYLGALYKDNLVSVMSFKLFKNGETELTRFCSKQGIQVTGIASKFLKHFFNLKTVDNLYTYADLRYSYGNLYEKLGFKQKTISSPSYYYCKNKRIFHRRRFQKKYLKSLLADKFNPNQSETENLFNNTTYRRIWDCGKIKYLYQR